MENYLISGLAHIGVFTTDAKKCAQFYEKHLGFRPTTAMRPMVFTWNLWNAVAVLSNLWRTEGCGHTGTVDHIALEVQGIEALVEKLKSEGITFETEEITKMPDFYPNGVKNIFFRGPAGERIELF